MYIQDLSLFFIGVISGLLLYRFTPFKSNIKSIIKATLHHVYSTFPFLHKSKSRINKLSSEEKLLHCFYQKEWNILRNKSIENAWNYDFSSIEKYNASVFENRQHLQEYLGKWHEITYKIKSERKKNNVDAQIHHLVFETGIPNLLFDAYLVQPLKKNEFKDYG